MGANRQEIDQEMPIYEIPEGVLECIGNKMWACINSTHWKHREAAALAFL